MQLFVSYLRVSTARQYSSGLGLEAQRAAVAALVGPTGPVQEYVEVESGRRSDRPKLREALDHARRIGATLAIARLDRLARSVSFVSALMDSCVEFVAADNRFANRLTIHILAAVAEDEARRTSERTRQALAAAKARGVRLGNPQGALALRGRGNAEAVEAIRRQANERAALMRPVLDALRDEGITSYKSLAKELNARGVLTARRRRWHPTSVKNLLERLAA